MSAKVELNPGGGTTFPSWAAGGTTTLWVENNEDVNGQVSVNAGAGNEYVDVNSKQSTSIQRQWGGIEVGVTNTGQKNVTVWTA